MANDEESAPAVWDPTARGGAGGWVRRGDPRTHQLRKPPAPDAPDGPDGAAPPPGGRPYLPTSFDTPALPDDDQPTALLPPTAPPPADDQQTALLPPTPAGPPPAAADRPGPPGPGLDRQPPAEPPTTTYRPGPPSAPTQTPGYGYPQPGPYAGPPPAATYRPGPPGPGQAPGLDRQPPAEPPTTTYRPGPPSAPAGPPPAPTQTPGYGYPQPGPYAGPPPGYGYPQQSYGGPPPGYGYPPPAEPEAGEPPRRSRTPLVVTVVVLVAAMLGGGLVWQLVGRPDDSGKAAAGPSATAPQPPPDPQSAPPQSPSPDDSTDAEDSASPSADPAAAEQQAKALDALLTSNAGARQQVGNAVATVESCPEAGALQNAAKVFPQAAAQREQLIGRLDRLDLSALDGGPDAAQLLRTAWQQSADADRAYAKWADSVVSGGCPDGSAPRTADRNRGDSISGQATRSKQSFVTAWNPIANRYGLASRTGDGI
ncbi:hypothetical protein ACIQGZ_16045 [Streptomyces sp. NPDC092296]|uniref:hypothetical protein n=1 Tax=Streptomyces sp. NPDC092296 TaxID=3366012 RepID=UPI003808930B